MSSRSASPGRRRRHVLSAVIRAPLLEADPALSSGTRIPTCCSSPSPRSAWDSTRRCWPARPGDPTFALQDYPGDASAIGRAYAGTYFVRDEAAARLTRERWAWPRPRSARSATRPTRPRRRGLRAETRYRIGAAADRRYSASSPSPPSPGHEAAFGRPRGALARWPRSPWSFCASTRSTRGRPGPRGRAPRSRGHGPGRRRGRAAEPWLAACDVVTTCFSQCSMDYAFLGAWSRGTPRLGALPIDPRGDAAVHGGPRGRDPARRRRGRARSGGRTRGGPAPLLARALGPDERAAFHAASSRLPWEPRRRDRRRGARGGRPNRGRPGPRGDPPRVLAVIAARGGSKGLPGKNLRLLGGRPLSRTPSRPPSPAPP